MFLLASIWLRPFLVPGRRAGGILDSSGSGSLYIIVTITIAVMLLCCLLSPACCHPSHLDPFLLGRIWTVFCTFFVLILWGMTLCSCFLVCVIVHVFSPLPVPRAGVILSPPAAYLRLPSHGPEPSTVPEPPEPPASRPVAKPITIPPPVCRTSELCRLLDCSFMLCQHACPHPTKGRPCAKRITLDAPDTTLCCLDFVLFLYYSPTTGGCTSWCGSCTQSNILGC